ncbi:hypothetical protein Pelo_10223 [Pelomyxa schiedti]|nr:hypothetical protein Pelo_10223 [Pelomyxa schiedti]
MTQSLFKGIGTRGGVRGGKDQFQWDQVKVDKYREYYLGQTVKTRPNWWATKFTPDAVKAEAGGKGGASKKTGSVASSAASTVAKPGTSTTAPPRIGDPTMRALEKELMNEALGIVPAKDRRRQRPMDQFEVLQAVRRGTTAEIIGDPLITERVGGIGFGVAPKHNMTGSSSTTKSSTKGLEGGGGFLEGFEHVEIRNDGGSDSDDAAEAGRKRKGDGTEAAEVAVKPDVDERKTKKHRYEKKHKDHKDKDHKKDHKHKHKEHKHGHKDKS